MLSPTSFGANHCQDSFLASLSSHPLPQEALLSIQPCLSSCSSTYVQDSVHESCGPNLARHLFL